MKLLLFDLDGTLVSTGGAGMRALDRAFLSLQRLVRASEGMSLAGRTDPWIIRDIFRTKLRREPHPKEMDDIRTHYLAALSGEVSAAESYRVLAGVEPLLEELSARADVLLALGTGNFEDGARIKLERGGLNRFFPVGGFGSDAEDRPEVLRHGVRKAAEQAGRPFETRDVIVIGDTVFDIEAGRALGAVTVAVPDGHGTREELAAARPDLLLDSLLQADALLRLL